MKKYRMIFVIYILIMGVILFNSENLLVYTNELSYVACGSANGIPKPIPQLTTMAYTLLIVGTPLVLISFSIVTLIKAITGGNVEDVMKAKNKLFKKFIAAGVIFLMATIVQFVLLKVVNTKSDKDSFTACLRCFLYYSAGNCPASSTGNDIEKGTYNDNYSDINHSTKEPSSSNSNSSSSSGNATVATDDIGVIRNIFYAIETGGQVYGQADYGDFTEAYTNGPNEHAITIGAGAWYATEAKKLLERIKAKDPTTFGRLDTAGIATDLTSKDWSTYRVAKNSSKAKAIKNIISSDVGKKVQDELMNEQVQEYLNAAKKAGINDLGAQVMYAEIRHCGGQGGAERIRKHAKTPYTAETMHKAATTRWPDDAGLSDPVNGPKFKGRHDCVLKWIKEYLNA